MGSPDKNRPPLTQDELEEEPGSPLPERVAMSLLGGGSVLPHAGALPIVDPTGTAEPPAGAEPLGGETIDPGPEEG
jgi:hypothetical protein